MNNKTPRVAVAGHICLDVIPAFERSGESPDELIQPGRLVEVGPAEVSTGGAVSNTGRALFQLGYDPHLIGKIGDDAFGRIVHELLEEHDPLLAEEMIEDSSVSTSYTVVVSPPGVVRCFLHSPGANHAFSADDVDASELEDVELFHFGYPPAMRSMYRSGGEELRRLLSGVKEQGITTSLDMTYPDPGSEVGQLDWEELLKNVLPHVDLFLPSLEEIMFMMDRERLQALASNEQSVERQIDVSYLDDLTDRLIRMGTAVAGIKLGSEGLYLHTTSSTERFHRCSDEALPSEDEWLDRSFLAPCFRVDVTGTTGAGDCAIAGFLSGWLDRCTPEEAMTRAVAAGACNLERMDATSGVPSIQTLRKRIEEGWQRSSTDLDLPEDWTWDEQRGVWCSATGK